MAVGLTTGFQPIDPQPGLKITIGAGDAVISNAVVRFPLASIQVTAKKTNYVYLDFSAGLISVSTVGFPSGTWPICTALCDDTRVTTLTDLRPDAFGGGAPGGPFLPLTGGTLSGQLASTFWNGQLVKFSDDDGLVDWYISGASFPNVVGTRSNQVLRLGWNLGNGGRFNTLEPAIGIEMEDYYSPSTSKFMEFHIPYYGTDGSVIRALTFNVDRATDVVNMAFTVDVLSVLQRSDVTKAVVTVNAPGSPNNIASFLEGCLVRGQNTAPAQTWSINSATGDASFAGSIAGGTSGVSGTLTFIGLSSQGPNLLTLSTELGAVFTVGPNGAIGLFSDFNFGNNTAIFNAAQLIRISGNIVALNGNNGQVTWSATGHAYDAATVGLSWGAAATTLCLGNGTPQDFSGKLKLATLVTSAAAPTVAAAQIGYGSTTAATASAGAGAAPPATVEGYIIVNVAGTARKIPYFAT